jgi:hypothetical protein
MVDVIGQVHPVSTMEADEYVCDRVDDLADLERPRIERFALVSDDGLVTLVLDRDSAEISAVEPDLATQGMLGEVERIASKHARVTVRPLILPLLPVLAVFALAEFLQRKGSPDLIQWIIVGVFAAIFIATTPMWTRHWVRPLRESVLYTGTQAEAPTWLQRNRDGLLTNAIVSAVFLVIGIIIGQVA